MVVVCKKEEFRQGFIDIDSTLRDKGGLLKIAYNVSKP
jgi:hypothetical protein